MKKIIKHLAEKKVLVCSMVFGGGPFNTLKLFFLQNVLLFFIKVNEKCFFSIISGFSLNWPLDRFGLVVTMSVHIRPAMFVCAF